MMEEHAVLSERLEDQLKAVEWAREQKKKITDDKTDVSQMHSWRR